MKSCCNAHDEILFYGGECPVCNRDKEIFELIKGYKVESEKFFKLAKPDGWDFYTGITINYRENIGKTVKCPKFDKNGALCSTAFLHASREPNQCFVGAKIPCSVYRVLGKPIREDKNKCGFEEMFVLEELKPEKVFKLNYFEVVNPINPFKIAPPKIITQKHLRWLNQWISVWESVRESMGVGMGESVCNYHIWESVWAGIGESVWESVRDSVGAGVWERVWDSVRASLWASRWESVWAGIGESVWESVWAYIGSLFLLKREEWKYTEKIKTRDYPFQPAVNLWKVGLIGTFDKKLWRLHSGENAQILYELKK